MIFDQLPTGRQAGSHIIVVPPVSAIERVPTIVKHWVVHDMPVALRVAGELDAPGHAYDRSIGPSRSSQADSHLRYHAEDGLSRMLPAQPSGRVSSNPLLRQEDRAGHPWRGE